MLLTLLLTVNIIVCLGLITVVLLQRSEGGALGGGSPSGMMTTRGVGDLLTRMTWILFSLFLALSLAMTLIGGNERSSQALANRLKGPAPKAAAAPLLPARTPTLPVAPSPASVPGLDLPPLGGTPAPTPPAR